MANYYEVSVRDVTDASCVGLGFGDTPQGEPRICIALEGEPINPELDPAWHRLNWISMTEACAHDLYELLHTYFNENPFVETEAEYFKRHFPNFPETPDDKDTP